jgi:hypothetical protein
MNDKQEKKSVSSQKLAANRKNAQRSTGPQTPAGKQQSSQNSYKHGFYALRLFPNKELLAQDEADYNRVLAAYRRHYAPVGDLENLSVEKIAVESLRLARLLGHEQKILACRFPFETRSIDRIGRYESNVSRQLERQSSDSGGFRQSDWRKRISSNPPIWNRTMQSAIQMKRASKPRKLVKTQPLKNRWTLKPRQRHRRISKPASSKGSNIRMLSRPMKQQKPQAIRRHPRITLPRLASRGWLRRLKKPCPLPLRKNIRALSGQVKITKREQPNELRLIETEEMRSTFNG